MDSVPFNFCKGVLGRIRPYLDSYSLKEVSPLWSSALSSVLSDSETISQAIIRPIWGSTDWEYCFVGSKYHRLEDLLRRSRMQVRIVQVRFQHEKERHRSYFRISAEDLKTKLISAEDLKTKLFPYVAGQAVKKAGFFCTLNSTPTVRENLSIFFSLYKNRQCFTELKLNYQGPATEDFLRYQFQKPEPHLKVYLRGYDWPVTTKAVIVDLIGRFRRLFLYTDRSNIDLDPLMLSMMLQYWLSGLPLEYYLPSKLTFPLNRDGLAPYADIRRDLQKPRDPKRRDDDDTISWELKHPDGTITSMGLSMYSESIHVGM
uniref:F-box domain-containing protein n=1 Tax=Steinernema glaseri TaxID=37863 RepID=A0A1I7ZZ39_9BILA